LFYRLRGDKVAVVAAFTNILTVQCHNFPVLSLPKALSVWQAQTTIAERTMEKVNVSGSTKTATSQTSSRLLTAS
jgi:hypothetical protein